LKAFFKFGAIIVRNHFTVKAGAAAILFVLDRLAKLDVKGWRAIRSVALVTLASGGTYLLFVLAYPALAGAL